MIVPPFYFKAVSDEGLIAYYDAVLRALPPARKVLLYNIPGVSAIEITEPLVDALLERFPERLLGLKDTSGDVARTRRYVKRYPSLAVYNGSDEKLAPAIEAGVVGSISAVANVFPDLLASVYEAHESCGDVASAQAVLTRVKDVLFRYPSHGAVKCVLHLIAGLPPTYVRPPLRDLTPDESANLERELAALEIG
jgi:4-hydroxy-tetrahydrodipicolinate synthase